MFKLYDKVKIVNAKGLFLEQNEYVECKGKIEQIDNIGFKRITWYKIKGIPYEWKEENLKLIQSDISTNDKLIK